MIAIFEQNNLVIYNVADEAFVKKNIENICKANKECIFIEYFCHSCHHQRWILGTKGKDYSKWVCGICRANEIQQLNERKKNI